MESQPEEVWPAVKTSVELPNVYVFFDDFPGLSFCCVVILQYKPSPLIFDFQPKRLFLPDKWRRFVVGNGITVLNLVYQRDHMRIVHLPHSTLPLSHRNRPAGNPLVPPPSRFHFPRRFQRCPDLFVEHE